MLSKEENELLTRVGPGTPMGELMRQYWTPALLSTELPSPDGPPVRVKLLGEELVAFRDTNGQVGLIGNHCPHRGASLFFGRNEECGIRCVYHGWKFDVTGQCVDMPNEPAESNFKTKIKATAYPCQERGGIVWTYMGPRPTPPPLPDLEANMLPEASGAIGITMRSCNWLQGLEGDIDTSHLSFLHNGAVRPEATQPGTFGYYGVADRAPRYKVVDTPVGTMYGAYRPAGEGRHYWRIAQFLFPFYVMIPTGLLGHQVLVRAWVPMDDTHMMFISMSNRPTRQLLGALNGAASTAAVFGGVGYQPNSTDWYGRFRLIQDQSNDYLIDREKQRRGESYTGIEGIPVQDQAITESMGPIFDRTQEHLGSSDAMVIRTRLRLMQVARALQERGVVPPGVDEPAAYAVRSGGVILPADADWLAATEDLRKAFVEHPELDLSVVGANA